MRNRLRALITWATAGALLVASPASAQQHVVDTSALYGAIAEQHAADAANRQTIERVLARPDVQAVAARLGLDIKDARTAIHTVSGEELAAIAQTAQAIDLTGGQTITISVVVLLLIIIIVILLVD